MVSPAETISSNAMTYRLPAFLSTTLAGQRRPPRGIPLGDVARAVLAGADCAIYAGGFVVLIVLSVLVQLWPSTPSASDGRVALVIQGIGVLFGLLASFRIWQVYGALRFGEAQAAEVVEARVGRARMYGTPWGEPMMSRGMPIAALGTYRLTDTGETGHYYMQQWWATALRPGQRIWVLRRNGRDVLYAPVN